jgi:biopolymer transport protein ExbB
MEGFTFREMLVNSWPVLSVLLIMSVLSVTVMLDRLMTYRKTRLDADDFCTDIVDIINENGRAEAINYCKKFKRPVAYVVEKILRHPGEDREALERAARHALQSQVNDMEMYVPILGTIASTSPFIGLFGTVLGIIRAFQDIAMNMGGGPHVVSAGIAEALITTAVGLFVAIPATIAYNYFIRRMQRLSQEIDTAVYSVIDKLSTPSE